MLSHGDNQPLTRKSLLANSKRLRYLHRVTEAFSYLDPLHQIPGIRAAWIERLAGIDVDGNRDVAMTRLRPSHQSMVHDFSSTARWWRAEQVHGNTIAVVPNADEIIAPDGLPVIPGVDGLITNQAQHLLSIYVADCGAIWLADAKTKAIGLLHSGKKGTELNILGEALQQMQEHFGSNPQDVTAVLSPCIRPPDYEIDFASDIARQAERAKLGNFIDCGKNTASDLARYYSYRKESGRTGRMMAMILRD